MNYNDKNMGEVQVAKEQEQKDWSGLVFVEVVPSDGNPEEGMGDWNSHSTVKR